MVGREPAMPTDARLEEWICAVRCLRDVQVSVRPRSGKSAYV